MSHYGLRSLIKILDYYYVSAIGRRKGTLQLDSGQSYNQNMIGQWLLEYQISL
jgi:hypothetical protein